MSDGLLSAVAAVAANRSPENGEFDYVGRFELNPRGIIFRGIEDDTGVIGTFGLQLSGYIGTGNVGSMDGRLYFGTGNSNFEFSIVAGYTRGFSPDSLNNNGFSFGGAIQFNPMFFWINQPIWVAAGYDARCYDSEGFAAMHMIWVGLAIMLDWAWNPDRYADPLIVDTSHS